MVSTALAEQHTEQHNEKHTHLEFGSKINLKGSQMTFNLAHAVYRHGITTPQALAISFEGRSLTYGELAHRASCVAEYLKRSPGWRESENNVQPRVGILGSRSADACIALLGACWAGATYVPIGVTLPEERLINIVEQCEFSAIVADEQGARLLSEKVLKAGPPSIYVLGAQPLNQSSDNDHRIRRLDFSSLPTREPSAPKEMKPSDTAYIIFTSGTTGVPKGVMISAGAIRHYIEKATALLGLRNSDRALETCELSFDVSGHNMFTTWEVGASLHILPASKAMSGIKYARENRLTVWNSVPSLASMLRQIKAVTQGALPALRLTVLGGEPLPGGLVDAWRTAAPNSEIYNFYGPTETTVYCLAQNVADPIPLTPGRDVVSIGTALTGNEAAVLDSAGNIVEDNCAGELAIAGIQLAIGYLNAPEKTNAKFPVFGGKRWYLTGDLAIRDSSGRFHCLGRIDNQVKVLGHRIELEEIDAHLRIAADVDMVATVAWPLADGIAQGLVAFVGCKTIDSAKISGELKKRLPHYMVPARIRSLENMPVNGSGKVDRKALFQRLETGDS